MRGNVEENGSVGDAVVEFDIDARKECCVLPKKIEPRPQPAAPYAGPPAGAAAGGGVVVADTVADVSSAIALPATKNGTKARAMSSLRMCVSPEIASPRWTGARPN